MGSSKREMNPDELARLFQQRQFSRLIRFDETPVPKATTKNISLKKYSFLKSNLYELSEEEFFIKSKLCSYDNNECLRPTVAGLLMCSPAPEEFLPNAFIQAVAYGGTTKNANTQRDAQDIFGSVVYF
jgi:ATP-dependent DNA helicase RecG